MQIPKEFKGTIYFYYWPYLGCLMFKGEKQDDPEYIYLGCSDEIHVTFDQEGVIEQAVDAIDEQIKSVKAEMLRRIETLQGEKQSLLALEHQEA